MATIELSLYERRKLREVLRRDSDATKVRSAYALLQLDDGEKVTAVAQDLGVGRMTIYYWLQRYQQTGSLSDLNRSGRPSTKLQETKRLLQQVIDKPPVDVGYPGYIWSATLLHKFLRLEKNLDASTDTIRRALRELDLSWQRPKFYLARESPTWRLAKGGSKEA
ncbi:MAG: helix-turn-helix domain-containing protein [Pseudobdellovibrionaceae bacterium]|nr:helix-turn-helix domain-containing protein [Pseudobdellovibrionaceae bacterium]